MSTTVTDLTQPAGETFDSLRRPHEDSAMATSSTPPASLPSVTVHALSAGFITLPSAAFIHPVEAEERVTVPSLSFLIQHRSSPSANPVRMVFDLGIRKVHTDYPAPLVEHLTKNRKPFSTRPDVSESLARGGLTNDDIELVVLSHVHWDHVGTPKDFKRATFVVGSGSLTVLDSNEGGITGGHSHFEKDLLPRDRTVELPQVGSALNTENKRTPSLGSRIKQEDLVYRALEFLDVIDIFGSGLVYLVDAPGHLQGHQNLLVKLSDSKWLYLAGDAAHDRRLLRGTHRIATWKSVHGDTCSIHHDDVQVMETLKKVRKLEAEGLAGCKVEVVFAHDIEWYSEDANKERFWPGTM